MEIDLIYKIFELSNGVSIDTRDEQENKIFVALKGERFNGNDYIKQALERNAKVVICDEDRLIEDDRVIIVNDSLETLQKLARHHKNQLNIPVIGITGSNGKTSTKELIGLLLNQSIKTYFTQGNFNNHIGVPLSLLSMTKDHQLAVIEMGANHPGEIAELCQISDPDYGIVTNVGKAHLEGFKTFKNIYHTKIALYEYVMNKRGIIYINNDLDYFNTIKNNYDNVITFSAENKADYYVNFVQYSPFSSFRFYDTNKQDQSILIETNLIGTYNTVNAISAIAIAKHFEVDNQNIANALKNYKPQNNRSQIINKNNNIQIILDAYNANPTSVKEAILTLFKLEGKKSIILGDMLELGSQSINEHQEIVKIIDNHETSNVILIGEEFSKVNKNSNYHYFKNTDEAKEYLKQLSLEDNTILIKGSRGIKLENTVEWIN